MFFYNEISIRFIFLSVNLYKNFKNVTVTLLILASCHVAIMLYELVRLGILVSLERLFFIFVPYPVFFGFENYYCMYRGFAKAGLNHVSGHPV